MRGHEPPQLEAREEGTGGGTSWGRREKKEHNSARPARAAPGYRRHLAPRKQPFGATREGSPVERPQSGLGTGDGDSAAGEGPGEERPRPGETNRVRGLAVGPGAGALGVEGRVPAPRPGGPAAPADPHSPRRRPTAATRPSPACRSSPADRNPTGSDVALLPDPGRRRLRVALGNGRRVSVVGRLEESRSCVVDRERCHQVAVCNHDPQASQ